VKKRILNLGIPATHNLIVNFGVNDALSISDFDALVLDPHSLNGISGENYARTQNEIKDLVNVKGGIVICLLRQFAGLGFAYGNRQAESYGIFDLVAPNVVGQLRNLHTGSGSQIQVVSGAKGASAGYFRVLTGTLRFVAYLAMTPASLEGVGGTVFALDSVQHPIGFEFVVSSGRLCFVPVRCPTFASHQCQCREGVKLIVTFASSTRFGRVSSAFGSHNSPFLRFLDLRDSMALPHGHCERELIGPPLSSHRKPRR
jgi:hypothetical protein